MALLLSLMAGAALAQLMTKPRVPAGRDPGGVAVAIIDTGVNYLLPEIAGRLARDGEGDMIGLDLDDGSMVPFDRINDDVGLEPSQRGTVLASMILGEAPRARLVTTRLKARDFVAPARAASFIAQGPARIVALGAAGTTRAADWETFRLAALQFKDLLFIVGAGSTAKDLDAEPIYPAGLGLDNVVVVAAGDAAGQLLPGQSYGARTVDAVIPAVDVAGVSFEGRPIKITGERAALARAAALAARISAAAPELKGAALKARLVGYATPVSGEATPKTRAGVISDAASINRTN